MHLHHMHAAPLLFLMQAGSGLSAKRVAESPETIASKSTDEAAPFSDALAAVCNCSILFETLSPEAL